MTNSTICAVFDQLDKWRHIPKYQLEPRASPFFALFLPHVLRLQYELETEPDIIPEFPLRHGTLQTNTNPSGKNLSVNVDYAALTKNGQSVFLVELKTDMSSLRPEQDSYLEKAKDREFKELVDGVLTVSRVPRKKVYINHTMKYVRLLERLSKLRLVHVPDISEDVWRDASQGNDKGLVDALKDARSIVRKEGLKPKIVYIQPKYDPATHKDYAEYIYFEKFADLIKEHQSIGKRFAKSLEEWAKYPAGSVPPGTPCL